MALGFKDTLARIFQAEREIIAEAPENRRRAPRMPAHQTALVEWRDPERGEQAMAGRLQNRSKTGLGIRIPRAIVAGKVVLVTLEDEAPVKAVVRHCSIDENGWRLGVELIAQEKRRADREPMHYAARVTCTRGGRREDFGVIIRDASEGGVQLQSPEPLPIDQLIEVSHLSSYREGVVSTCREREDGYRIGVQFIGPARRSQRLTD